MKIAIVENERTEVEGAFTYLNSKHYAGSLECRYFKTSQDFLRNDPASYRAIFVDIHLTTNSQLDGFGLIRKLLDVDPGWGQKIVVLTGFHRIDEKLKELRLPQVPVVVKPANFNKLLSAFRKVGISPESAI